MRRIGCFGLLLAFMLMTLAFCAGDQANTAESTFAAAREAQQSGSYDELYDLLAPTTQKEFLGTVLVHCSFATLTPDAGANLRNEAALDAIFAKHGVTGLEESPLKALANAADTLEDPGALAADLVAFALEHRGTVGILELVDVRDVAEEDDKTIGAAMLRKESGETVTRDIEFVREEDGWRLRLILQ